MKSTCSSKWTAEGVVLTGVREQCQWMGKRRLDRDHPPLSPAELPTTGDRRPLCSHEASSRDHRCLRIGWISLDSGSPRNKAHRRHRSADCSEGAIAHHSKGNGQERDNSSAYTEPLTPLTACKEIGACFGGAARFNGCTGRGQLGSAWRGQLFHRNVMLRSKRRPRCSSMQGRRPKSPRQSGPSSSTREVLRT